MLVLSRKLNEEIVIDGRIRVRIIGLQGGRVRIGVSAPNDVSIQRAELLQRDAERELQGQAFAETALIQSNPIQSNPIQSNPVESKSVENSLIDSNERQRAARLLCRIA